MLPKKIRQNPDPNPDFSGKIRIPETVCRIELKFSGWIFVDILTYLIHQRTESGGPVAGKPVPKAAGSHTFDHLKPMIQNNVVYRNPYVVLSYR